MKINANDIQIQERLHINRRFKYSVLFKDIILLNKYRIAGLRYITEDSSEPHWQIFTNSGDNDFIEYLYEIYNQPLIFNTEHEVKEGVFPYIHKFLEDKPDDYLNHRTSTTTPY